MTAPLALTSVDDPKVELTPTPREDAAQHLGYAPTRRKDVEGRAARRELARAVQLASRVYFHVGALALAVQKVTQDEIRAMRSRIKLAKRERSPDMHDLDNLERAYMRAARELAARMEHPDAALAAATSSAEDGMRVSDDLRESRSARRIARARLRGARIEARATKTVARSQLSDAQASVAASRADVVRRMQDGASWIIACAAAGVTSSRATVMRWQQRYLRDGIDGLIDRRVLSGRPSFPPEVRALARASYRKCRKGGSGSVYQDLKLACEAAGVVVPSPSWVADFMRYEIPPDEKIVRDDGIQMYDKQAAPRAVADRAHYANEVWQVDDAVLDTWVRVERRDGSWEPAQPFLTLILDVYSRAVMAASVFTRTPNALSVQLTIRKVVLPKPEAHRPFRGVPTRLVMDNGKNFKSKALALTLSLLNVIADYCTPHSPNEKPQVERLFRTLQEQLLPRLPGYKKAHCRSSEAAAKVVMTLLTIEQLRAEVERWIDEYNATLHSGISTQYDYTPRKLWEESARVQDIDRHALDRLLLHETDRTVGKECLTLVLRAGEEKRFWSPTLVKLYGQRVTIAYNPEDLASILVSDPATQELLCEAYDLDAENPRWTSDDLVTARHKRRDELQGVVERVDQYHRDAEATDRRSPRQWDAARSRLILAAESSASASEAPLSQAPSRKPRSAAPAPQPTSTPAVSPDVNSNVLSLTERLTRMLKA